MNAENEINRRRTFAIIAHPDAGKTTLTEKLLLYGGAVHLAGSVTARRQQRATTSDWMELERQRGISVNSTVLQFEYGPYAINLLDTPGHNDFSEDTYRVLMAVDGVVMVIDAGKGIESQTRKLFEVCRLRGIPIFTFMNKCDRPTREPLELLDEIEQTLQLETFAMNWPAGTGSALCGIYDRLQRRMHFFDPVPGGATRAPVSIHDLSDPVVKDVLEEDVHQKLVAELGLLDHAGTAFDPQAILEGNQTPVFFGSAVKNFGVQLLLDGFLAYSPPPGPRRAGATLVDPANQSFSGFIFKIQSNMNPRHRDRIAFVRVCSGHFRRDMVVFHSRTKKFVRLTSSHKVFAREREIIEEAWPGDVVGIVGNAGFGIGDTLSEDPAIVYQEIPRFAPECFAFLQGVPAQYKRFRSGLEDLIREGLVQSFLLKGAEQRVPLLGAVGPLQFDVLQYRLKSEYGADSRMEPASWKAIRWVAPESLAALVEAQGHVNIQEVQDERGATALLFREDWNLRYFLREYPAIRLRAIPEGIVAAAHSARPRSP